MHSMCEVLRKPSVSAGRMRVAAWSWLMRAAASMWACWLLLQAWQEREAHCHEQSASGRGGLRASGGQRAQQAASGALLHWHSESSLLSPLVGAAAAVAV